MALPRLSDGRLIRNLNNRTIVLPNNEEIEFVGATPENERYQPGFIVFEREEPVLCEEHQPFNPQIEQSGDYLETIEHAAEALREQAFEPNHVSLGLDVGADGNPVMVRVSARGGGVVTRPTSLYTEPNGSEAPVRTRGQDLLNEMIRILGSNRIAGMTSLKQKPIDRLYPHQCHREYIDKKGNKKKCPRNLKFEELLLAEANKKLKASFIDKVFGYLTEHYSQFSYDVRAEWSDIFGKFEYRQYLRKLWKNPRVQFYCCACFRKATLIDVHDAVQDDRCSHAHERDDFLLFCMRYGIDIQLEQFRQCNERFRMEYCYSHTLNEYPSRESDYLKRRRHDSIYTQYLEHSRGLR